MSWLHLIGETVGSLMVHNLGVAPVFTDDRPVCEFEAIQRNSGLLMMKFKGKHRRRAFMLI